MTGGHQAELFAAFREDHTILGRAFHRLSTRLRAGDLAGARAVARELDRTAGAHIAFEEADFYPRLATLIGRDEVAHMYAEHELGLGVVRTLCEAAEDRTLHDDERSRLLADAEAMERHIAECGELFEAIGRIPPAEQAELRRRLVAWRERAPTWCGHAGRESRVPSRPAG
jgi:hypothetical protein